MQYYLLWRGDDGTPHTTGPFTCKLEAMEYPFVETAQVLSAEELDELMNGTQWGFS